MKLVWIFDEASIKRIRDYVDLQKSKKFVLRRKRRNCGPTRKVPSKRKFVRHMIGALVTTQQRSGPNSRAAIFIRKEARTIAVQLLEAPTNAQRIVAERLKAHGLRFGPTISTAVAKNIEIIQSKDWLTIKTHCTHLARAIDAKAERAAARALQELLSGFGPKQSRNILQTLGLTRYETPLDSRVMKWLAKQRFPAPMKSKPLADEDYYSFAMDGFASLSAKVGVLPCILDAAIFAENDGE